MYRRSFLASSTGVTSVFAGCGAIPHDPQGEPRHPFADETVSVHLDIISDTRLDIESIARESLAYWEQHAEQYAGFSVAFELDNHSPNMTISYVDTMDSCRVVDGFNEHVLGCAPIITPDVRLPREIVAYVLAGNRPPGSVRITTKHEIGHILGLTHDDEPREIMSNLPEDRIPLYELRISIWEEILDGFNQSTEGTTSFKKGIDAWSGNQYDAAQTAFASAHEFYNTASELIVTARGRTDEFDKGVHDETVDLATLHKSMERFLARLETAKGFSLEMASASSAASDGDGERANEHVTVANELIENFNDIEPVELRDIAVALGLIEGIDRDDSLVDIGDPTVD